MKQYFKKIIIAIAKVDEAPLLLPLVALASATLFVACGIESATRGNSSARVGKDPRDLTMAMPMAAPTREKLVVLSDQIPLLQVDLRYAKSNNVSRRRLYDRSMPAMLDQSTAKKLAKAQKTLLAKGYALKVWDAYRPPAAHLRLWKRSGRSGYVADPRLGWSKHCSGRAVDVTLVDANTGLEVEMPSKFDDFSKRASSNYRGSNFNIVKNLAALKSAMKNAGFIGIKMEWWHFENKQRNQDNLPPIYADEIGIKVPH
ncbi:MAG: D-alanyl-D-alanine dipeptidase [Pseudoalteromonas tetraodonis]